MKKIYLFIVIVCTLMTSCFDLNVNPDSKLTDDTIYKTKDEFIYGLSGVYSSLKFWSEVVYKAGGSTDEMIFPARGADWKGDLQPIFLHQFTPNSDELNNLYVSISESSADANNYIDCIDKSPFAADPDIQTMRMEARFIRAFDYYLLMDMFGNVPLVTSNQYDPKNPPSQVSRTEVYAFIEKELTELSTALPQKTEYGRVNQYIAKALLAKLYLNAEVYLGQGHAQWNKVTDLTDDILKNSGYKLEDNFKDVFKWDNDKSKENMFTMVCDSRFTEAENISYLFSLSDMRQKYNSFADGWNGCAALPTFYRSFEDNDIRKQIFIAGPQVDANNKPVMGKDETGTNRQVDYTVDFKSTEPVTNARAWDGARGVKYLMDGIGGEMVTRGLNNDMPIIRFADILMMRAEALFRMGQNTGEALTLVNQVRTRNGHNPIAPFTVLTEANLLAERGREFAWEGWRRNDLIRFGKYTAAWDYKPADAQPERNLLFPIPQKQLDSNHNLKQNPGY